MKTFTVEDVAALCQVHRITVYRWVKEGRLPAPHKIGRRLVWRLDEIELATSLTGTGIMVYEKGA